MWGRLGTLGWVEPGVTALHLRQPPSVPGPGSGGVLGAGATLPLDVRQWVTSPFALFRGQNPAKTHMIVISHFSKSCSVFVAHHGAGTEVCSLARRCHDPCAGYSPLLFPLRGGCGAPGPAQHPGDTMAGTGCGPGPRHDVWCPLHGWVVSTSGDGSGGSRALCRARLVLFSPSDGARPPHRGFGEAGGFALEERRISHPEAGENPAARGWDLPWLGALGWKGRLSSRSCSPATGRG